MSTLNDIIDFMRSGTKPFREWEEGVAERATPEGFAEALSDNLSMDPRTGDLGIVGVGSTLVKGTKFYNDALAGRAEKMYKKGASPFEVLNETGSLPWKTAEGQDTILQFTDEPAKILKLDDRDFTNIRGTTQEDVSWGMGVDEAVNDKVLRGSYPELVEDLWIARDKKLDSIANYNPNTDVITVKDINRPSIDSDIMHEVDHGIQNYTGLQGGGDPKTMEDFASKILSYTNSKDPYLNQILSRGTSDRVLRESYGQNYRNIGSTLYRDLPGEVLSRIAEGTQKGIRPIDTLARSGQRYKDILFEPDINTKIQKIIRGW